MGLLDQIAGAVGGSMGQRGAAGNSMLNAVLQLVANPGMGGLAGLLGAFQQRGLGDVANSWVSTGRNQPISADQVREALGSERIRSYASEAGVSEEEASEHLAQYLPEVVDKLTPDGSLPRDDELLGQGLESLKGRLFG